MTFLGTTTPFYGGGQVGNPANVIPTTGAPSSHIKAKNGTLAIDNATGTVYAAASQVGGVVTWTVLGGGTGAVATLTGDSGTATPVAGNIKLAGTANQITSAASGSTVTFSLPNAITAPGSILATTTVASTTTMTAGTGFTATTGNISATAGAVNAGTTMTATAGNITATNGNFVSSTSGKGLLLNSPTTSGAASGPVIVNGRSGAAVFTTVSIAANADLTLTITNSAITGSSTQVIYSLSGVTTGAALSIKSVTNTAGSSAVVVTNGSGDTTSTSDITLTFLVLN